MENNNRGGIKSLLNAWFGLTKSEQAAVALVVALFLLGLAVRFWHIHQKKSGISPPSVVEQNP
jgi:hypothetical protein